MFSVNLVIAQFPKSDVAPCCWTQHSCSAPYNNDMHIKVMCY